MGKINCYEIQEDLKMKKGQIIYLKDVLNEAWNIIAEITQYAKSTCKTYYYKYKEELSSWANRTFKGKREKTKREKEQNGQKAYVLEFYSEDNKEFKWLKIGKTHNVAERLRELKTHKYNNCDTKKFNIEVKNVHNFDSEEKALSMENLLRHSYKLFGQEKDFVKNDRFINQHYAQKHQQLFDELAKIIEESFEKADILIKNCQNA